MNKLFVPLAVLFILFVSGCEVNRFKQFENGMEYKIIKDGNGADIVDGSFISARVWRYYNDSLIGSPYDSIPQIIKIDSVRMQEYGQIFMEAKVGDSIVTRVPVDSVAKYNNNLPPFAKPHQYLGTRFKIVDSYADEAHAQEANMELDSRRKRSDSLAFVRQQKIDDKTITDYLKKNKINAVKSPDGTYVEVEEEGTGPKVETGSSASVLYRGMLLDGHIFDESYDSIGNPGKPFTFIVGRPGAIAGWSDGMVYFREGGKGRLFIPSSRAYGPQGAGGEIAPNTPIMFDVNITKVEVPTGPVDN